MTVKEAYALLERYVVDHAPRLRLSQAEKAARIMRLGRAYGDARELKGHVDACGKYKLVKKPGLVYHDYKTPCGHGWYCDQAPLGGSQ